MPRILRIINRFALGGPIYNAAYLTRYMPDSFETLLIGGSPEKNEAHSGFILDKMGVPFQEIPSMARSINLADDMRACREISTIIRQFKPDIVHTHASKAGVVGRIAAHMNKVPIIVHTFHGHVFSGYFGTLKSKLIQLTEQRLASFSDAIIAISASQKRDLTVKYSISTDEKVQVIPLGFDLTRFSEDQDTKRAEFRKRYLLDRNDAAIGLIGRLVPIKNHHLFIDALSVLRSEEISFKAFIIGDGEMRADLEHYALRNGLRLFNGTDPDYDLCFTSWMNDVDRVMSGLDIVALTSLNEGTPVSLIEAQASYRPVVTTDAGGVRDCVCDEKTGIIVRDFSPISFATALRRFINDADLRVQFGTMGHEFSTRHFSHHRLISDTTALYNKLLQQKRSVTP